MNFFGGLALVLLTLVGFSSGAVIVGREKKEPLGLLDLGMVVLFLAMALVTRPIFGKWLAIPIWFILAGLASALLTEMLFKGRRTEKRAPPASTKKGFLGRVWHWWKVFATDIGNYQGRILFAFFYFVVVTLFGIGVRLFSDPLKLRQRKGTTCWSERSPINHELEAAREQF